MQIFFLKIKNIKYNADISNKFNVNIKNIFCRYIKNILLIL